MCRSSCGLKYRVTSPTDRQQTGREQNCRLSLYFLSYNGYIMFIYESIQDVSRLVDITAGGDFLGLCDQKSSYKHVSDFGRLRS